jgi:hypothetical protein
MWIQISTLKETNLKNRNTRLYLDVDGVFLRRTGQFGFHGREEFIVANHATEILEWCRDNFDCQWLTGRSHNGSTDGIERAFRFSSGNSKEIQNLIRSIDAAAWDIAKISAIDFSKSFLYVDDNPGEITRQSLVDLKLEHCWIKCCTDDVEDDLLRIRSILEGELAFAGAQNSVEGR